MHSDLKIECLRQRCELEALEPEWNQLLESTETASPFLTPGWQAAWLDTYGRGADLYVLVARRGERLVGLWPLTLRRRAFFRVLEPVGAGRSDWLDILCHPEEQPAVVADFLGYLAARRGEWDLVECRDVLDNSPTRHLFESLSGGCGLRFLSEVRTAAPYLALVGNWDQYLSAKSANFRSNLNRRSRRVEREMPSFSIGLHQWQDDDGMVKSLAEVELQSWKAQGGNLKVSTLIGQEFYRRFCAYFANRGQLHLWRADVDGTLVAFLINIHFGGKCYFYNGSFDQRYANISPGLLLHANAIRRSFEQGLSEYDFLSGEESYKEHWSSDKRLIHHTAIHSSRIRSRLAFSSLVSARWALRRSMLIRAVRARLLVAVIRLRALGRDRM